MKRFLLRVASFSMVCLCYAQQEELAVHESSEHYHTGQHYRNRHRTNNKVAA